MTTDPWTVTYRTGDSAKARTLRDVATGKPETIKGPHDGLGAGLWVRWTPADGGPRRAVQSRRIVGVTMGYRPNA
jgi:hypothetical protein